MLETKPALSESPGIDTSLPPSTHLANAVWAFLEELHRSRGSYGVQAVGELRTPAEQAALRRLRQYLTEYFEQAGWQPSDGWTAPDGDRPSPVDNAPMGPSATPMPDRPTPKKTQDRRDDARREVEQMREALRSRATIEQAKGIVMARFGLSADQAWSYLVRQSQESNTKVRLVAAQFVESVAEGQASG